MLVVFNTFHYSPVSACDISRFAMLMALRLQRSWLQIPFFNGSQFYEYVHLES